jgi:tetratricopeptide (TPR) repeat protein
MRFVEALQRASLLAAIVIVSACASLNEPLAKLKGAAGMAAPSSAASAASAPALVKAEPEVAVSAATQRVFDDARRALAAGHHDEAEKGWRALVRSNPELAGPHANLGILYRQAGKLPEAVAEFETAVQINPQRAATFNQLGVTYRQQGQFAKARAAYEKAMALDPAYAAPCLNLGILHDLYFGDRVQALDLYGKYLALSPAGDATVTKWVADIKNRKPQQQAMLVKQEQP